MSEIVIRALEPSDTEAVHALFAAPRATANTLQVPWRSLEERRSRLASTDANTHRLVATLDGRVVGTLGLHIETAGRRRDVASFGMAVHDEFAGRGVGSALIAAMIDLAENWLGIRRIELTVYADNEPAIHLYEKFGFVREGIGRAYARRNGELVDALYMARLRPSAS